MYTWHTAAIYCEEVYGVHLDSNEGFFICPEYGEPLFCEDWREHDSWEVCPICGGMFEED